MIINTKIDFLYLLYINLYITLNKSFKMSKLLEAYLVEFARKEADMERRFDGYVAKPRTEGIENLLRIVIAAYTLRDYRDKQTRTNLLKEARRLQDTGTDVAREAFLLGDGVMEDVESHCAACRAEYPQYFREV